MPATAIQSSSSDRSANSRLTSPALFTSMVVAVNGLFNDLVLEHAGRDGQVNYMRATVRNEHMHWPSFWTLDKQCLMPSQKADYHYQVSLFSTGLVT